MGIYIQLILMLGAGFDQDPQIPWAAAILNDKAIGSERARIDSLHDKAWEYAECIAQDYENADVKLDLSRFVEQLPGLRQQSHEVLDAAARPEFLNASLTRLRSLFPKKCEYIGEALLPQLADDGIECAASYGVYSRRGALLFIVMMFVLGAGFHRDPQLPWVSAILNDEGLGPNQRVDRLMGEAVTFLNRWWDLSR